MVSSTADARWNLRTTIGRRAADVRRAIGSQIRQMREDAGLSQHTIARAAGIPQSHLSEIERGVAEASVAVLVAIGHVLGADVSVRFFPGAGPRIHDRFQAPILEALLAEVHPSWRRLIEVPVWRPVRGVIDTVFAQPGVIAIATEIHSELRRLEQQLRWGAQKAEALRSAEAWSMLAAGQPGIPISQLLVLRNSRANRDVARAFQSTLATAFPARAEDAVLALREPAQAWLGAAVIWADVERGVARILDRPPRGVSLGRS